MHKPQEPEKKLKPTDEQVEILDAITKTQDNILVNALAGSGKTSTIEMIVDEIDPLDQPLYVAFNKAIVDEAKDKLPSHCEIRTLNSLGHRAWGQTIGKKLVLPGKGEKSKTRQMFDLVISELKSKDDRDEAWENLSDITQAVGMAKHTGYIPDGTYKDFKPLCNQFQLEDRLDSKLSDFCWSIVDSILGASIQTAYNGFIDYDDQIYMSALFGGSFQGHPIVLVDESQDLSPANHAMLDKIIQDRLVTVGDRWQSIYAFRGAATNSVDRLKEKYKMREMPLSISFRCPENIVRAVHWHVPHMKWFKTGGRHGILSNLDAAQIKDHSTIVCRNNAPLFSAAFSLLSNKRSVSVAGSDIGPKIINLLKKVGREGDSSDILVGKIEEWREEKLRYANNIATINDTAECMKIFATWGKDLGQAISYATYILNQTGAILLTTGHKSKGREWDTVYHLNPSLIRDEDQDRNLKYVITTRAKEELYEIEGTNIQWL
jgi:hypothetical protein